MKFVLKKRDNIFFYWKPDPEDQLKNTEFLSFQGKIIKFIAPNRVEMFAVFAAGATVSYFDHRNLKQHVTRTEIEVEVSNEQFAHADKMMKQIDRGKDYVLNSLSSVPVTVEQLIEQAEKQKRIAEEYEQFLLRQKELKNQGKSVP